jgi:SSS family solute:Na+ symporter
VADYVIKDRRDDYYLSVGRWATVGATVIAIGTARSPRRTSNIMDYLQTLFGFLQRAPVRNLHPGHVLEADDRHRWLGRAGGRHGRGDPVGILSEDALGGLSTGVIGLAGQGASFAAAGAAFVVDIIVSVRSPW